MKAVFFDVDGTLIEGTHPDYRYMRENVQKAIRKLQEQGHYVFIASGRSLAFLDEKIRNFGFDGYVLLNGSVIFFHDKIIYRAPLEKFFVEKITSICDEHDMQYSLQGDFHTYVDKKSGQTTVKGDEYARSIGVYGKDITLYAPSSGATNEPDSDHKISISPELATFGHTRSYIKIPYSSDEAAEIGLQNQLNINTALDRTTNISTGQFTLDTSKGTVSSAGITLKAKNNITISSASGAYNSTIYGNYTVTTNNKKYQIKTDTNQLYAGNTNAYIQLRPSNVSNLYAAKGLNITTDTGGITLKSESSNGIILNALPPNGQSTQGVRLSMIPQDGGGSDFILTSPHGSVRSITQSLNNTGTSGGTTASKYGTIQIMNGFSTQWGQLTGGLPHDKNVSLLAAKDIKTTGGWFYGGEIMFHKFGWSSANWGKISSNDHALTNILVNMYNDYIDRINNLNTTLRNLISNAQNRADSAYNLANNKVDWSTYNGHTHNVDFGSSWVLRSTASWVGVNIDGTTYHVLPNGTGVRSSSIGTSGPR